MGADREREREREGAKRREFTKHPPNGLFVSFGSSGAVRPLSLAEHAKLTKQMSCSIYCTY